MSRAESRILGLDVLRGFAAFAVMLYHHGWYYDQLYPGRESISINFAPGHFGVELFFIISGFVILMTAESGVTVGGFVLSRLTRLMPAFLVTVLITTAILTVAPMPPLLGVPTPLQFLANLTMAPGLFEQPPIDLTYWTLTYELVFYAYMALVLCFGLLGSIEWLGLVAVVLGTLCVLTVDMQPHHRSAILLMLHYSNFFVIGICLYRIYARRARLITYVALFSAVAANVIGGGEQSFYASGPLYLTLSAAFALLVWFGTSRYQRLLLWPPLVYLGKISYPLYLVHVALGFEIIRFGARHGWSSVAGTILACLASLAAAVAVHHLVEVPGTRRSRAFFKRRRRTDVPQSAGPAATP